MNRASLIATVVLGGLALGQAPKTAAPAAQADEPEMLAERVSSGVKHVMQLDEAIGALAERMRDAIAAGDVPGYLELVDLRDPVFATEQRNWAQDLLEKKPSTISVRLAAPQEQQEATLDARRDLAMEDPSKPVDSFDKPSKLTRRIMFAWSQHADSSGNPEFQREVAFDAVVEQVDGTWKYGGEAWERIEHEHVIVMFDPGLEEVAATAAEAFEKIRTRVLEGFDLSDAPIATRKQIVKLYKEMQHLQHSIYLSYPFPLGGWNEPGESIKILASRRMGEAALKGLLSHEFGHVCTFELGPKANDIPWWVLEGVAELSTTPFNMHAIDRAKKMVRRWAQKGELKAWTDLTDFRTVPAELHGHVYSQGMHMVWYVSNQWGREGRLRWLTLMAQGKSLDEATREVCDLSFEVLDAQWRASLSQPLTDDADRDE